MLAVPFSFVSSAFVPIETMPALLRAFAGWQPLTFMINAWRGLVLGDPITATFERSLTFYVSGSLLWTLALLLLAMPLTLRAYRRG
jgi:ABC-2 type transport system permease protein